MTMFPPANVSNKVLEMIEVEMNYAKSKHPEWPEDCVHGAAIVAEESGELVRAALQVHYENGDEREMVREAAQTAVTAMRFLEKIIHG